MLQWIGAVDETRTRDLHLGKVALYQLSYYRKWCPGTESNHRHVDFQSTALPTELPGQMATRKGLEPSTSSVTGWHSNQLNYRAIQWAFRDLNPGPIGYEPTALTTELKALNHQWLLKKDGDLYGIRTRVTAVKGRCLNRLTKRSHRSG